MLSNIAGVYLVWCLCKKNNVIFCFVYLVWQQASQLVFTLMPLLSLPWKLKFVCIDWRVRYATLHLVTNSLKNPSQWKERCDTQPALILPAQPKARWYLEVGLNLTQQTLALASMLATELSRLVDHNFTETQKQMRTLHYGVNIRCNRSWKGLITCHVCYSSVTFSIIRTGG